MNAIATPLPPQATAAGHRAGHHPQVLRGGISWFPDYLDPQLSYSQEGWMALYNSYIPLLTYRHAAGKAGSEVIPGLARSMPRISDRGTTYTLFLRRGLEYSDGRRVKASDFEFAIERLFKLHSGGAFFYAGITGALKFLGTRHGGIAGIETNDRTGKVVIHLDEPRGAFTSLLALPFAAPVPRGTPARNLTADPPPATGPYVISDSDRARGWTESRNPAWSRNGRLMPKLPDGHVDRITMSVIRNSSARIKGVEEGKLDLALGAFRRSRYAELERKYGGTRFRAEPVLATAYFWMNTRKAPFNDLKVRQAVNYALDRSVLRRIFGNGMSPTEQILPPGMPGYQKFAPYPHDIAKARQLIAEAHPRDRDITVWTDDERPERDASAYYCDVLEELGFAAHLKVVKYANYFSAIGNTSTPDLDTGWSGWFADYPHPDDFFGSLLAGWDIWPTENENLAQIEIPALDQGIFALGARSGPIPEGLYATLDRVYTALAPWAPIGNPTTPIFVSRSLPLKMVIWNPSFAVDLTSLP
ncbi:MAG TPA: ABC transporter substrate-binding protein [Solirubrobacterales bacterium]|nr:ABC transporter substrate-binding protein [Solirubrobacterales bacterium]